MDNKRFESCPFCGCKEANTRRFGNGYRGCCSKCGARGPFRRIQKWHDNKFIAQEQARRAWNERRAPRSATRAADRELLESGGFEW